MTDRGLCADRGAKSVVMLVSLLTLIRNIIRSSTVGYRASFRGLPRKVWYLAGAQLVNSSGTMVILYMTLYLTGTHHFSLARAGQIMSGYGQGMMLGAFLGGWLADRAGAHRTQRLALFATGTLLISLGFVYEYRALYALTFLWGVANGAVFPANFAAMGAECPPELRSRGFSLLRLANNLGMTAAPILGGFLISLHPRLTFYVDGASCMAAAVLLLVFFPWKEAAAADRSGVPRGRGGLLARDLRLWSVFLATLGLTLIVSQIFTTWPPYLREKEHLTELQIGMLFAISTSMIVLFQMPMSHGATRYSHYRMAALGALFYSAAFVLMSLTRGTGWQIAALVIWTTGEMLVFPALATIVSDLAPVGAEGKYQGIYSFAFSVGMVIGPAGGSVLAQQGGWSVLWGSGAFVVLGSAMVLFLLDRHTVARAKAAEG